MADMDEEVVWQWEYHNLSGPKELRIKARVNGKGAELTWDGCLTPIAVIPGHDLLIRIEANHANYSRMTVLRVRDE